MKVPVILLADDQDVPLTHAPVDALRAFVGGNFDLTPTGPNDNPMVCLAIAKRLLAEKEPAR